MIRLLALLALLCLGTRARADEETWLSADGHENPAYFAPKLRMSSMNGKLALWPGARIGWMAASGLSAGFEGYILANEAYANRPDTARFNMAVGGVVFEAIRSPASRTHLVLSLLIGAGGAQAGGDLDLDTLSDHKFFVAEPGLSVEFNLTRTLRFSPGVSYLWISGTVPGMDSKWNASETAYTLTIRFREP